MQLPVTVNLLALARQLDSKTGKRKFASMLRDAWRAQSCVADLKQAKEICEIFKGIRNADPTIRLDASTHVQSALMISAILLYARATSTSGAKERGSIQLELSKLSPQQKNDHLSLIRIRNAALAHVETDTKIGHDFWHKNYLFAKQVAKGTWSFASGSASIGLSLEALAMLDRQLPIALQMVSTKCRRRLDDVVAAFAGQGLAEATMLQHQVDPVAWFGSWDSAHTMLGGAPGEEASNWMPLI